MMHANSGSLEPLAKPSKNHLRVAIAQLRSIPWIPVEEEPGSYIDPLREVDSWENLRKAPTSSITCWARGLQDEEVEQAVTDSQQVVENSHIDWVAERVQEVLDLSKLLRCDLVVFPELSVPARCLQDTASKARAAPMTIIAGSHYVRAKDIRNGAYEKAGIAIDEEEYRRQNLCPVFLPDGDTAIRGKRDASQYETRVMKKGKGPFHFKCQVGAYKTVVFLCNEHPPDCAEYSSPEFPLHVVVASTPISKPSSDERVKTGQEFWDMFDISIKKWQKPVVFANNAEFGCSTLIAWYDTKQLTDERCQGTMYGPLDPGFEGMLVVDVDPRPERQNLDRTLGLVPKPVPTSPVALIPVHYDSETIPDKFGREITYRTLLGDLLAHGFSDERMALYASREAHTFFSRYLGNEVLVSRLRSVFSNEEYVNLSTWDRFVRTWAITLTGETLEELQYVKLSEFSKYLTLIADEIGPEHADYRSLADRIGWCKERQREVNHTSVRRQYVDKHDLSKRDDWSVTRCRRELLQKCSEEEVIARIARKKEAGLTETEAIVQVFVEEFPDKIGRVRAVGIRSKQ